MRQFIIPYLSFKDSYKAAQYYKDIFDGEIVYIMKGKEVPNSKPEEAEMIMHLELKILDNVIYMFDGDEKPSDQIMLHLNYSSLTLATKHYDNMKAEGKVIRKLEDTFWGAVFGVVEDKYGMKWQFHVSKPRN